jgi:hypothetical protein
MRWMLEKERMRMTRGIFDPRGGEAERSGSRNLGPDAQDHSHLPADLARAEVTNAVEAEQDITGKDDVEELQQYRFKQKPRKRRRSAH